MARSLASFALALMLVAGIGARAEAPLAGAAQRDFQSGLEAARQQQWDAAIEAFERARGAAPNHPPLLFNLGLAYGKAGLDLPSIKYLHAYLAAAPRAPNAAAVKQEIERRKAAARAKIIQIFATARQAAAQIPDAKKSAETLSFVENFQARAGDIDGAIAARGSADRVAIAREYAYGLAEHDLFSEAEAVLREFNISGYLADGVFAVLAASKIKLGDLAGARAYAMRATPGGYREPALADIEAAEKKGVRPPPRQGELAAWLGLLAAEDTDDWKKSLGVLPPDELANTLAFSGWGRGARLMDIRAIEQRYHYSAAKP